MARSAPPADQFALAVDLGTSGLKVGLVSLTGAIAWHEHMALSTRVDGAAATQDAVRWWELVREAARRGLRSGAVPSSRVVAVSVTGQWASTVPVDAEGRPVGECLLWMDTRGAPWSRAIIAGPVAGYSPRAALAWIRRSGGAPSPSGADPSDTSASCSPPSHADPAPSGPGGSSSRSTTSPCASRCTAAASHASMAGAWLTDNRAPDRLAYDPVLVARSASIRTACPRSGGPDRSSARSVRRWPRRSACPTGWRWSPAPPTSTRRPAVRVPCSTSRPIWPSAPARG